MTDPLQETAETAWRSISGPEDIGSPDEAPTGRTMSVPALDSGRIVVISPHLDDAVLSVGGTIATAARSGASVEVLTVFGYGPVSAVPAGPWDVKSGFQTEADACRTRRDEDREACRILGATPRWLDFGAEPYDRRGTPAEILSAVIAAVAGADCVLFPGFPLAHPDHAELTRLLLGANLAGCVGLYAEQPYLYWERKTVSPAMRADAIGGQLEAPLAWTRRRINRVEGRLKSQAIRCYRSQLYQLGLSHIGLFRMLWHESSQGGEAIAWLP
ncbi:MAG TPA: PIG-L family deacetylase [Steroidobacteraceae bacterium]|jgi:LmbE family N-acetylglucosaminyl deacetylase|nr:PIG-L family deacetylase [Steroidobacteraceae bacterium]